MEFLSISYWNILGAFAAVYLIMSIVTYLMYWRDKSIAKRNTKRLKQVDRVPERTLHILEFFFGWPGALVAQRTLNHKSKKRKYQLAFWPIVILHIAVWAIAIGLIVTRSGA